MLPNLKKTYLVSFHPEKNTGLCNNMLIMLHMHSFSKDAFLPECLVLWSFMARQLFIILEFRILFSTIPLLIFSLTSKLRSCSLYLHALLCKVLLLSAVDYINILSKIMFLVI